MTIKDFTSAYEKAVVFNSILDMLWILFSSTIEMTLQTSGPKNHVMIYNGHIMDAIDRLRIDTPSSLSFVILALVAEAFRKTVIHNK